MSDHLYYYLIHTQTHTHTGFMAMGLFTSPMVAILKPTGRTAELSLTVQSVEESTYSKTASTMLRRTGTTVEKMIEGFTQKYAMA